MGATFSKGYGSSVQPLEPEKELISDCDQLKVDDSALDCVPAGYHAKRRQAVREPNFYGHTKGWHSCSVVKTSCSLACLLLSAPCSTIRNAP